MSIIFFQVQNLSFELILVPRFAKFPASPFPVCALRSFLYFLFILLALSCVGVFARANLRFFLGWLMVLVLDTLMFLGKVFLLILSYLATKDVPLGRFTLSGTARFPSTIFCLLFAFFFFYLQKIFLI